VIALLLLGWSTYALIVPVYGQVRSWDAPGKSCLVDGVPTLQCLEVVYDNLLYISSWFVMLILFLMLVYGGVQFMLSFGDSGKIESAKNTIWYALMGLGLFSSSYLILWIIDYTFLGGKGLIFQFKIPGPASP
jgi:hypothetical protein